MNRIFTRASKNDRYIVSLTNFVISVSAGNKARGRGGGWEASVKVYYNFSVNGLGSMRKGVWGGGGETTRKFVHIQQLRRKRVGWGEGGESRGWPIFYEKPELLY